MSDDLLHQLDQIDQARHDAATPPPAATRPKRRRRRGPTRPTPDPAPGDAHTGTEPAGASEPADVVEPADAAEAAEVVDADIVDAEIIDDAPDPADPAEIGVIRDAGDRNAAEVHAAEPGDLTADDGTLDAADGEVNVRVSEPAASGEVAHDGAADAGRGGAREPGVRGESARADTGPGDVEAPSATVGEPDEAAVAPGPDRGDRSVRERCLEAQLRAAQAGREAAVLAHEATKAQLVKARDEATNLSAGVDALNAAHQAQLDALRADLDAAREDVARWRATVSERDTELTQVRADLTEALDAKEAALAQAREAAGLVRRHESGLELARVQVADLAGDLESASADLAELTSAHTATVAELARLKAVLADGPAPPAHAPIENPDRPTRTAPPAALLPAVVTMGAREGDDDEEGDQPTPPTPDDDAPRQVVWADRARQRVIAVTAVAALLMAGMLAWATGRDPGTVRDIAGQVQPTPPTPAGISPSPSPTTPPPTSASSPSPSRSLEATTSPTPKQSPTPKASPSPTKTPSAPPSTRPDPTPKATSKPATSGTTEPAPDTGTALPDPAQQRGQVTTTLSCTGFATITFTATGPGKVVLDAGGEHAEGSGRAAVTIETSETVTATATADGATPALAYDGQVIDGTCTEN